MTWIKEREDLIPIWSGQDYQKVLEQEAKLALKGQSDYIPKELAYSKMEGWNTIAADSQQTTKELAMIEGNAKATVEQLDNNTHVIDMGAANSLKYKPYFDQSILLGKNFTYVPLDLNKDSLWDQRQTFLELFPNNSCTALCGTFDDGHNYFHKIDEPRLFLSLGSIFFNGPNEIVKGRCAAFAQLLKPNDVLIVGQDAPPATIDIMEKAYTTKAYIAWFAAHVQQVNDIAGIEGNWTDTWNYKSESEPELHQFALTPKKELKCTKMNYTIPEGQRVVAFPSWKRGIKSCQEFAEAAGLKCEEHGRSGTMFQLKITKQ